MPTEMIPSFPETLPVIQARDIVLNCGNRRLLDKVSIYVNAGEVVALMGPNGAGKSTLLKILSGDTVAAQGEVCLAGKPLNSWDIRQLALLRAVLAQQSRLSFSFSALQVVEFGRFAHKMGAVDAEDKIIASEALGLL